MLWNSFIKYYNHFWRCYPALWYGLMIYLGACTVIQKHNVVYIALIFLFLPYCLLLKNRHIWKHGLISLLLFSATVFYVSQHYEFPQISNKGILGKAHIKISTINNIVSPFSRSVLVKGTIKEFTPEGSDKVIAKNIPFSLFTKRSVNSFSNSSDCIVKATLKKYRGIHYILKPLKNASWQALKEKLNIATWRYNAKYTVSKYIKNNITTPQTASFLTGITTGEFDDQLLRFNLSKLGLQHIMAISGFHFTIIATFLALLLKPWIMPNKIALILTPLLISYAIFIGNSPSIQRALICVLIALWGIVLHRKSIAINSLGIALSIIILYDPLVCQHIGFQFSFLATFAILLFYPLVELVLYDFFPARNLMTAMQMKTIDQHGYIFSSLLRRSLSLVVAVHVVVLPLILYHFHKFPLLSLIYNLFFPFLISLSLILLLIGVSAAIFSSTLAHIIHEMNNIYTTFILRLTTPPPSYDYTLFVGNLSPYFVVIYLCSTCLLAIWCHAFTKVDSEWQFV